MNGQRQQGGSEQLEGVMPAWCWFIVWCAMSVCFYILFSLFLV